LTALKTECIIDEVKRFLLLILCILFLTPASYGEDFPARGGRDEYPIYWYVKRYGERLKQVYDKRKIIKLSGWGTQYLVEISRDGTMKILNLNISQNKYFDNRIKEVIEATPAEPFGDEIDLDKLLIDVYISHGDWFEHVDVMYGPSWGTDGEIYGVLVKSIK